MNTIISIPLFKKISQSILLVMGLVAVAGCTTKPHVDTDYMADYNFAELKNFHVAQTKQDTKEDILISPFTLSHIHSALESELSRRYQNTADAAQADFVVSYHVVVEEKIDPRSYNELYGYGYYGLGYPRYRPSPFFYGPGMGIRVYNQGSLIIDILDAKAQKPLWRGVSSKRLSRGMAPANQREVLSKAVTEVISQFPPVK
jgi:Domain of unknown function (DUF4136)